MKPAVEVGVSWTPVPPSVKSCASVALLFCLSWPPKPCAVSPSTRTGLGRFLKIAVLATCNRVPRTEVPPVQPTASVWKLIDP